MIEMNDDVIEKMLEITSKFVGAVASVVCDTEEQGMSLIDEFATPDRFIEYENDGPGLRAFFLATAKKCVELLERN